VRVVNHFCYWIGLLMCWEIRPKFCCLADTLRFWLVSSLLFVSTDAFARIVLDTTVEQVKFVTNEDGVIEEQYIPPEIIYPGDQLRYTIKFVNTGTQPVEPGVVAVITPIPPNTRYVYGSAIGLETSIDYSMDGDSFYDPDAPPLSDIELKEMVVPSEFRFIRWTYLSFLPPGEPRRVFFNVRIKEDLAVDEDESLETELDR